MFEDVSADHLYLFKIGILNSLCKVINIILNNGYGLDRFLDLLGTLRMGCTKDLFITFVA